jgi:hypothetical protein
MDHQAHDIAEPDSLGGWIAVLVMLTEGEDNGTEADGETPS